MEMMEVMGLMEVMKVMGVMKVMEVMDVMDVMEVMEVMRVMELMEVMEVMEVMGVMGVMGVMEVMEVMNMVGYILGQRERERERYILQSCSGSGQDLRDRAGSSERMAEPRMPGDRGQVETVELFGLHAPCNIMSSTPHCTVRQKAPNIVVS